MTYYYNHPLSFSEKRTSSSSPEQMQKRSFMAEKNVMSHSNYPLKSCVCQNFI